MQAPRRRRPAPACRRARRRGAGRPRAAWWPWRPAPRASRPDWRCSSRRSAGCGRPAHRAACARRGRRARNAASAGRQRMASAPSARSAASTASEFLHVVLAGRADAVGEALRAVPGDDRGALGAEIDLQRAKVGLLVIAEGDDLARRCALARSRSSAKCGLSRGSTAVPPGTRPCEDLGLGLGDGLDRRGSTPDAPAPPW